MRRINRREFIQRSALGAATTAAVRPAGLWESAAQRSPNNRIQIGIIGVGARVQSGLQQAAMAVPGVEVVGVVDAYRGRVERAIERTGGRAKDYGDYKAMLADKSIDAVIIATPDHWHRIQTVEALAAGKDVYLEKPMTYVIDDGQEMISAAKKHNKILQIGSQGISSKTQQTAREMIQSGRLGQVTMIRASYNRNTASGAWLYPIPPDANEKTVNWEAFLGPADKKPFSLERFFRWRCYWDYSGGIATDLFVHLITTINYVMNAKMPTTVTAMGSNYRYKKTHEVPDTVNAILEYPEAFTVNLSSTFNNQSASESGFEILGTEAALIFRGGQMVFKPENVNEDNAWVVTSWPSKLEAAYYDNPKVRAAELPGTWKPQMKKQEEIYDEVGEDATFTHMAQFFDSVRTRKAPIEDGLVGHRAAASAHMVNESIRKHKSLHWDFASENVKKA